MAPFSADNEDGSSVPLAERQDILKQIESHRANRAAIAFINFDRASKPQIEGLMTQFHADAKEALFRVLKESGAAERGVDLLLYTRGGDTNAVWPIVSLLREFDQEFEVLVPFRCHSAGTLVAMAAHRIHMGPLSELSPIDPTTGNQFNPRNPSNKEQRLGISVEDVQGYLQFVKRHLDIEEEIGTAEERDALLAVVGRLVAKVHPLALGNVYRVNEQIRQLASHLLGCNPKEDRNDEEAVGRLTTRFYSHLHLINRHEARDILGSQVVFADETLAGLMDDLLQRYDEDFQTRKPFILASHLQGAASAPVRFAGAVVESPVWAYMYETTGTLVQRSQMLPNMQVQLQPGQSLPIIPGMPRHFSLELEAQGWIHNTQPKGITK